MARGTARQPEEITPAQLRAASDELQALIAERVPVSYPNEIGVSWPAVSLACMARMGTSVDAITTLAERGFGLDGQAVLRSLYEHAITFCWLAIDPAKNLLEWTRTSEQKWRALYEDAKRFGHEIMSAEAAGKLGKPERKWRVDQVAEEVDEFWSPRIDAIRPPSWDTEGLLTFRGMYVGIFRPASRIGHAEPWSLDPLLRARSRELIITSEREHLEPLMLCVPLTALCLLVYREHFGWPEAERAQGISDSLLYEPGPPTEFP